MNDGELLITLALLLPLFAAVVTYAVGRMPDVRETLTMVACIGCRTTTRSAWPSPSASVVRLCATSTWSRTRRHGAPQAYPILCATY